METVKYKLYFNGEKLAEGMEIKTCLLLAEAVANAYYEEIKFGAKISISYDDKYSPVENIEEY